MALSKLTPAKGHCAEHGDFDGFTLGDGPHCPACGRKRAAEEVAHQQEALMRDRRQRRANELLGKSAIPVRFSDRRLDNFLPHAEGPTRALGAARQFAADFSEVQKTGRSLVFCGGVGAGKTHLAVGICHEVMNQDKVAVFTSVLGAVRSIKDTYRKDTRITEADAIKRLIEPDLLVLDEVGVQFGSDTEKMYLFEIINGRYENLRPTIVISNLAKKELIAYLGERVVDRLREGGGKMIIFDWPSYRSEA